MGRFTAVFNTSTELRPSEIAAGIPPGNFGIPGGNISLIGDTDTVVQCVIAPEDFVAGAGTEPEMELELGTGGSTSAIAQTPTPSVPGGETITAVVRQQAGGTGNDFSKLRAIHLRLLPLDPNSASKGKVQCIVGDPAAGGWELAILPLGFDSTESGAVAGDRTPESEVLLILPKGHTYSASFPLHFVIYEALNVVIHASFLGK